MADLPSLWAEHADERFPSGCTGTHGGCNLVVVDSEIRAAVIAFVETGLPLAGYRKANLETSVRTLEAALPQIPETGKSYFGRTVALGKLVLGLPR